MYRGLAIVYALAAVAALVMAYFAYKVSGLGAVFVFGFAALGLGVSCRVSLDQSKRFADALDEIGGDPTGVDTCRTYSLATAELISQVRMPPKTFLQLFIAYGSVDLTLFAGGIFLVALGMSESGGNDRVPLVGLGALLVFGGVLLGILTVRAFRNWRDAKALE